MIISMYGDIEYAGNQFFHKYPCAIYGLPIVYEHQANYVGILSQGEDLFVSAHVQGETLGGIAGHPQFTPLEFSNWLKDFVLPWNYQGKLYIATDCELPEPFVSLMAIAAMDDGGRGRLYGTVNSDASVPPHWDSSWAPIGLN